MKKMAVLYVVIILAFIFALSSGAYVAWNVADPEYTCAQCHEIKPTHEKWSKSAHADVSCYECHGTAISNGLHSLKEKLGMVVSHFAKDVENRDIKMTEKQVLDVASRCVNCHRAEYSQWKSGAHSTTYANIFEDKAHNRAEKPYWECLRCHGMFYDGNIKDLMDLDGGPNDWKIKDRSQCAVAAVPCLACHQIHMEKKRPPDFKNCAVSETPPDSSSKLSFYARAERSHIPADCLTPIKMYLGGEEIKNSADPAHVLCQQCHSPNWKHEAGSSDDRTPVGAHEGMSCLACHNPHSGSASASCAKCHDVSLEKYRFKKGKCPQFINKAKKTS